MCRVFSCGLENSSSWLKNIKVQSAKEAIGDFYAVRYMFFPEIIKTPKSYKKNLFFSKFLCQRSRYSSSDKLLVSICNRKENRLKESSLFCIKRRSFHVEKTMAPIKDANNKHEHVNQNADETMTNGCTSGEMSNVNSSHYDYDYIVIGGGPGGMSSAKEAAAHGAKVLLLDFVKPSSQGTKWGVGGTCVNVGCVPKKLMHYAGMIGSLLKYDSNKYGWEFDNLKHNWPTLVKTVQSHIRSLNFSYLTGLRSAKVKYVNALGTLKDKNTVTYYTKGDMSKEETATGKYILIATGCRPNIPEDIEGAKEYSITSDDIFSLKKVPGRTLVVGASYVALECAGFLNSLGFDVSVAVRSIVLRGFDQQCANKVKQFMKEQGVRFINCNLPKRISKEENSERLIVEFSDNTKETFDTVLYATGRKADTAHLNLEKVNVNVNKQSGKIITDVDSSTNIKNIFAVGDVAEGIPELAPVAIKAGEILARRLFKHSEEIMDYTFVATSIYTPIEYGACGYSEENAYKVFGEQNVEVFLQEFNNLEISAVHRNKHPIAQADKDDIDISATCFAKLVCLKNENNRVVGFHYIGPNAGEVTQGMALALKLKATKQDFDTCVGIHPTDAEAFMNLFVTRSSGLSFAAKGGCGGGKCG